MNRTGETRTSGDGVAAGATPGSAAVTTAPAGATPEPAAAKDAVAAEKTAKPRADARECPKCKGKAKQCPASGGTRRSKFHEVRYCQCAECGHTFKETQVLDAKGEPAGKPYVSG